MSALRPATKEETKMGEVLSLPGLAPPAPPPVSIDEQIACAKRECDLRRRIYPRWVADGRMTAAAAFEETRRMEAILKTLQAVARGDRS